MNLELKHKVRVAREDVTGLSQKQIMEIGLDEENAHIEAFTGEKVTIPKKLGCAFLNRGNPYLASGNITPMETVDDFIEGLRNNGKREKSEF